MKPTPPPATEIASVMQEKAKVCATIAEDKTEISLTGEPSEKTANEADAKDWKTKSAAWLEAEAIVRAGSGDDAPPVPKQPPLLPLAE
jgi:hypothetical protein